MSHQMLRSCHIDDRRQGNLTAGGMTPRILLHAYTNQVGSTIGEQDIRYTVILR